MSSFRVRTDLALEVRENMEENAKECRGVSVEEQYREESEIRITKGVIQTMNGDKAMGKPIGTILPWRLRPWCCRTKIITRKSPQSLQDS